MRLLIKNAQVIASQSPFNGQIVDLLIENGLISSIGDHINDEADEILKGENLHVSPGWMDTFAHFCDPGTEFKEDMQSGAAAAAAGGYTAVMVIPDTKPTLDSKTQIEYIRNMSSRFITEILPIGAVSKNLEGNDLAEMYEMKQSGAVAFSDGLHPLQQSGLLLKALQYVKAFNGVIIQIPDDRSISAHGLMHEGIISTQLGMPGKPAIAEEILIRRDLELAQYADSAIHFTGISTSEGIALIKAAKERGIKVSCSVTPYHLMLTDELLQQYNALYKVNPPLRSKKDVKALQAAVKKGIIDCIATHHIPQDIDHKQVEFEYAEEGMIGLESCFGILNIALKELDLRKRIQLLSENSRRIFNQPVPEIREGSKANLTIFNPEEEWVFSENNIHSKSKNTPFFGQQLKGKVKGVVNNNRWKLFNL